MKPLALVLLLTWGFALYDYGRLHRVSGFASYELCERIRRQVAADYPRAVLAPACTADQG